MPDFRRRVCRLNNGGCGKTSTEVGPISWRGLCESCGRERMNENVDQLEAHDGPNFTNWRRGMAASVGAELLDDRVTAP